MIRSMTAEEQEWLLGMAATIGDSLSYRGNRLGEAEALKQDRDAVSTDILAAATVLSDARLVKAVESVPEIYRLMGSWRN